MVIKNTLKAIFASENKHGLFPRLAATFAAESQRQSKSARLFFNLSPVFTLPLRRRRRFSVRELLNRPVVMAMSLLLACLLFYGQAFAATPTITVAGSPVAAMTATYGTASASQSFTVSGTGMTAGITITEVNSGGAFEFSLSAAGPYSSSVTVGSGGTIATTTVYIRLAAASSGDNFFPSAGAYSGYTADCSSPGAATVSAFLNDCTVNPGTLTITASNVTQTYGSVSPPASYTISYSGFITGENQNSLFVLPQPGCPSISSSSNAGTYTIYPQGDAAGDGAAVDPNYNIVYVTGTYTVSPAALTLTATGPQETANQTPGGIYTTNFSYSGTVNGETISSVTLSFNPATTGAVNSTYIVTPSLPTGPGTFLASNYTINTVNKYNGTVENSYNWTGATGTAWNVAGNWSGGVVPGANDIVTIPNVTNAPTITASTSVNTIQFTGNNTITINTGKTLTVSKALTNPSGVTAGITMASGAAVTIATGGNANVNNSGNFTVTGGTLTIVAGNNYIYNAAGANFTFNGGIAFHITGNGSTANTAIYNAGTFTVGQSGSYCALLFDDSQSIMNLSSGTFIVGPTSYMYYYNASAHDCIVTNSTGGTFLLQSDATGSAGIFPIPQGQRNSFVGTFTVQRYFSANRGYRLLSSPVYAATTGGNKVFSLNYINKYAFITGDNPSGGFDKVQTGPTIYLYNESKPAYNGSFTGGNYRSISDLTQGLNATPTYSFDIDGGPFSIPVSNGFLFFYRGDRNAANASQEYTPGHAGTAVTMQTSGSLNTGSFNFSDWYKPSTYTLGATSGQSIAAKGFNLIGNPYPCNIDLNQYDSTKTTAGIYAKHISQWVYELNPVSQNYEQYGMTSHTTNGANASRYVMSGQGFFVQATASGATLTLNETAKETTNTQNTGTQLFMGAPPADPLASIQYIKVKLGLDSVNTDETMVLFSDTAKAAFDITEDAIYRMGSGKVNLSSMSSDSVALAINVQPLAPKGQSIRLRVGATASGNYTLGMSDIKGIPPFYRISLIDKKLNDTVNLRTTATYAFTITLTDTATFGANRFLLAISPDPALAYKLLDFDAIKLRGSHVVDVTWHTKNEGNYTTFTVERSTDEGRKFEVIGGLTGSGAGSYGITDKRPGFGWNLYRLKQQDINGTITYSSIVPVDYSNRRNDFAKNGLYVFPNPAIRLINLAVPAASNTTDSFNFLIASNGGRTLKQGVSGQPYWQYDIEGLLPGTYIVKVFDSKTQALIGSSKFIKL